MARLRISLTIPGAVSLGAYEGGALAALLVACQKLGEQVVVVDSIASASAGSITGLLSARALPRGADPVRSIRLLCHVKGVFIHAPDLAHTLNVLAPEPGRNVAAVRVRSSRECSGQRPIPL